MSGRNRDLLIDPARKALLVEEDVAMASLSVAMQAAVKESLGGGEVLLLESVTKNGAQIAEELAADIRA